MSELSYLQRSMEEGFKGINARLDRVNGRLDNHGERLSGTEQKLAVIDGMDLKGKINELDGLKKEVWSSTWVGVLASAVVSAFVLGGIGYFWQMQFTKYMNEVRSAFQEHR